METLSNKIKLNEKSELLKFFVEIGRQQIHDRNIVGFESCLIQYIRGVPNWAIVPLPIPLPIMLFLLIRIFFPKISGIGQIHFESSQVRSN